MLRAEDIILNQAVETKDDAIRRCGALLHKAGIVDEAYIESMIARDASFSTAIGNLIAIPHGEKSAAGSIKKTGLSVITYPDGLDWGGAPVKIVIGIAALGDEHLSILENIVEVLEDESDVEKLVAASSKDEILKMFTGQ